MDEHDAIQRLKQGNLEGLEWLVLQYQIPAIRVAFLITRDVQIAEDVVQEEYIRFYKHQERFDSSRPFKPWFIRCVMNSALKAVQKQSREINLEDLTDCRSLDGILPLVDGSPENQVERDEFQEKIWAALGSLSPKQRLVIVQRYYLEMSEKEMSGRLKNAPGTVKWLLNAARLRLKSILSIERGER